MFYLDAAGRKVTNCSSVNRLARTEMLAPCIAVSIECFEEAMQEMLADWLAEVVIESDNAKCGTKGRLFFEAGHYPSSSRIWVTLKVSRG